MKKFVVVAAAFAVVLSTGSVNAFMHDKLQKQLEDAAKQLEQQMQKGQKQPKKQSQQQPKQKPTSKKSPTPTSGDFQKGLNAYKSGDYATALREWKPLAEQGNASAQKNMGVMYERGHGVPQNDKTAVKWYRLAAETKRRAQKNVGQKEEAVWKQITKNGRGIWGLKFGMSSTQIERINNESVTCYKILKQSSKCKHKSGRNVTFDFNRDEKGKRISVGIFKCPCTGLKKIELSRGDYTSAGWNKTFRILKKKYKLVKSPTAEEQEKFMFGANMEGHNIVYMFENTKDKSRPKYLLYNTKYGTQFRNLTMKRKIFVSYITELEGKEILGVASAKKKADDDL